MRYTEYHAGVPVIRDKELLPGAMKKLAKLEDMGDIREIVCDGYCNKLKDLFEALDGIAPAQG